MLTNNRQHQGRESRRQDVGGTGSGAPVSHRRHSPEHGLGHWHPALLIALLATGGAISSLQGPEGQAAQDMASILTLPTSPPTSEDPK